MQKLFENCRRSVLKENVYSEEMHAFIQNSYELDNLIEHKKITLREKHSRLYRFFKNNNFTCLGEGLTRAAYQSPGGEVVKIVRSVYDKAIGENKKEIRKFNQFNLDAFPKIEAYDDRDYLWFIVEYVEQIGKGHNSIERYKMLFPKLFTISDQFREKIANNFEPTSIIGNELQKFARSRHKTHDINNTVKILLKYKWNVTKLYRSDYPPSGGIKHGMVVVSALLQFSTYKLYKDPEGQRLHKDALSALFKYYENPDPNFARLLEAMRVANVNPDDFHSNNLGFNEKKVIKIIDAGFGHD